MTKRITNVAQGTLRIWVDNKLGFRKSKHVCKCREYSSKFCCEHRGDRRKPAGYNLLRKHSCKAHTNGALETICVNRNSRLADQRVLYELSTEQSRGQASPCGGKHSTAQGGGSIKWGGKENSCTEGMFSPRGPQPPVEHGFWNQRECGKYDYESKGQNWQVSGRIVLVCEAFLECVYTSADTSCHVGGPRKVPQFCIQACNRWGVERFRCEVRSSMVSRVFNTLALADLYLAPTAQSGSSDTPVNTE